MPLLWSKRWGHVFFDRGTECHLLALKQEVLTLNILLFAFLSEIAQEQCEGDWTICILMVLNIRAPEAFDLQRVFLCVCACVALISIGL